MRKSLLLTALFLAIAACADEPPPSSEEITSAKVGDPVDTRSDSAAQSDGLTRESASVGPLRFSYDPDVLRRTEARIALPPDYEREKLGTKLIPAQRAARLGEESCRYGQSGMVSTCTAEQEAGLELALLDGSLSRWRDRFAESIIGTDSLESVEVGGAKGFRFTAQAEGSGAEYNFLPAGESTVLVARRFRFGQDAGTDEIARIIDNLEISR